MPTGLFQKFKKPGGSTLILGLIIIVLIAFGVTSIAYVVLNALRSTQGYTDAIRARYAEQSGIERGLYYVEASRRSRQIGITETVNVLNTLNATFDNGADYAVVAEEEVTSTMASLDEGETLQLDLYNEEYSGGYHLVPMSMIDPVLFGVMWNEDCPPGEDSKLEISFVEWDPYLWQDFNSVSQFQNKYVVQCAASTDPDFACMQNSIALTPGFLYKVRLKAVNCSLPSLVVYPTINSVFAPTSNYITMTGVGSYGRSEITEQVRLLWRTPLIDYFDYVLFSEQDVIK